MRYSKAEILFSDEPIWKAVHESERKEIFADALVGIISNCHGKNVLPYTSLFFPEIFYSHILDGRVR